MNDIERRQLSAGIIIALPVMAWVAVANKTETLTPGHKIRALYQVALETPHKPYLIAALVGGLVLAILCVWLLASVGKIEFAGAPFRKFLRGTRIVSAEKLARETTEKKRQQVTLAKVPIPTSIDNLHMLIGGGTGAGKSTLFREVALGAAKRRDRMICLDPNGDMLAKFWKEGDVILNPYDQRTEGWSFFNEIRADYDFHRYALSIVPLGRTAEAEEWAGYGRLLLRETARKLAVMGQPSIRELFRWTTIAPPEELQEFLSGTLAESLFVGSSEATKALSSARFVLSDKLPEHVAMPQGAFSLRTWLENPKAGNLWITWREDMAPALRPLISAWIDALFVSILSMPEDPRRRIWAFIDELASLEKLATLEDALTKGRKYGLRVIAGLQSTSQLDDIYGRDKAQTLRSCFSSLAVLRISKSDPATADDFSKALGEHEVERESRNSGTRSSGTGKQTVHERERVVAPAELTSLPDLAGYIAFVGDRPIARFKTEYQGFKNRHPGFVERSAVAFGG
ncbi:IncW plasmid conjugative protein TrwB [Candidatus Burkholderia verschuerenii]|uniref:IncW plasmid conjugative protein TrwB n=1 Tax=Candidatus Burkholderia verschuerenii TaxID=242163 RepID=A0A0L0ME73_9BURK|nr:type IV secretion system DNA-binding domain-containing protein [Candidatus Burkholderia verschuerenii]KND60581.1 IncW plasmid conjugative protein TrwB [Candidatus Burkholderia verschuerenii]